MSAASVVGFSRRRELVASAGDAWVIRGSRLAGETMHEQGILGVQA